MIKINEDNTETIKKILGDNLTSKLNANNINYDMTENNSLKNIPESLLKDKIVIEKNIETLLEKDLEFLESVGYSIFVYIINLKRRKRLLKLQKLNTEKLRLRMTTREIFKYIIDNKIGVVVNG